MRYLLVVLFSLALVGCFGEVVESTPPPSDAASVDAPDTSSESDAGTERKPVELRREDTPVVCGCVFHYDTRPDYVRCYMNGGPCPEDLRCEPILPVTETSGCRFRYR